MNFYKASIGTCTKKGNFNCILEQVVSSEANLLEVKTYYEKKYSGLTVSLHQIEEVVLHEKKPEQASGSNGLATSRITEDKTEYGSLTGKYYAYITRHDIDEWEKLLEPIAAAEKSLAERKQEFQKKMKEKFGLKRVDDFKIISDGITFSYYSSWFDWKGSRPLSTPSISASGEGM